MMEKKTFTARLNFKEDGEKGEFEAVIATLNVKDHDNDVTLPGAFGKQAILIEPWNHNLQAPPVGKGVLYERDGEAVVEGRFFLQTESGREHYEVAKELGHDQEWSYTFEIVQAERGVFEGEDVRFLKALDVWGAGQVTRGAGINTRLTSIKEKKQDSDEGHPAGGDEAGADEADGKSDGKSSDVDLLARISVAEATVIRHRVEA